MAANIGDLVARLEKVTARLEAVEKQVASGGGAPAAAAPATGGGGADVESPFLDDYDENVACHLKNFIETSKKLDGDVGSLAETFMGAVSKHRELLVIIAQCKEPSAADMATLCAPLSADVGSIISTRDSKRASKFFQHLSAMSEGVPILGWALAAAQGGKPVPYCKEYTGNSEFYSNKLLMAHKNKDDADSKLQVEWVKQLNTFLKEMCRYVKQFHTTKAAWKANGGDAKSHKLGAGGAAPKAPSGAPPPPGPPPPPAPSAGTPTPTKKAGGAPNMNQLFSELNKGEAVTAGLKKVTRDMQTHKNPNLRAGSTVPAEKTTPKTTTKKKAAQEKVYDPVFEQDGLKWKIQHQKGNKEMVLEGEGVNQKQTVYMYKCENSVLTIKEKMNSIVLDNCKKCAIVFPNLIAACEVVNCTSIEIQCSGRCPAYAVDKTSGFQLYLTSADGLNTELVQSKSDAMNILIPGPDGGDLIELPVAEQFKTEIKNSKLITAPVEHV